MGAIGTWRLAAKYPDIWAAIGPVAGSGTPATVEKMRGIPQVVGIGDRQIVQAVIIASASNNVLKMVYTYVFGSRRTADLVAPGMIGLVVLSMIYAVIGL